MSRAKITTPEILTEESVVELKLRPQRLAEFIGQAIIAPPESMRQRIADLTKAGELGKAGELADEWATKAQMLLAKLK